MNRLLQLISILVMGIVFLTACGTNDSTAGNESDNENNQNNEKTYQIGITQFVEHPSLDEATKGFKDAIEEADLNVEYDFQSAQGELMNVNPVAQKLVSNKVDLIFANATPSAQGALDEVEGIDIPIVFTSVTDAVEADLIAAMDEPSDQITGVVDLHPDSIIETIGFIDKYFKDSTIGLLYNAGEQNSVVQIKAIQEAVDGTSLSILERTVANSSEVNQAATTLVGEADVFFIVTDNTVVSALDSVISVANDHQIPLFVGEPDSLAKGGFATYGIDYYTIGYRSGEMAVEILKGEKKTSDIPVEYPSDTHLFINKEAAEVQGVEWNDEWDDIAEFIEQE